ncbi:hypothetical protein IWQ60_012311, partial [Tieghemiomyces parasiticus]
NDTVTRAELQQILQEQLAGFRSELERWTRNTEGLFEQRTRATEQTVADVAHTAATVEARTHDLAPVAEAAATGA